MFFLVFFLYLHFMKRIPIYKFYRHKYGGELLVDIVDYKAMWPDIRRTPVFTETFHSITLVLEGNELVELNGQACRVGRGTVITSIPGEVWWFHDDTSMLALNLVFEKDFLLDFFRDSHFLDQFAYLAASRPSPFLQPDEQLFFRLEGLYREMQHEINDNTQRDLHLLRALLYETLMLLSRAKMDVVDTPKPFVRIAKSHYIERFEHMVEDHFTTAHSTEFYADQLCITPNYLNKITHQVLGISAKSYIQQRRMQEACRQLEYTTLSVQEIADKLGYESATYFVRSFGKFMGTTPIAYRNRKIKSPEK